MSVNADTSYMYIGVYKLEKKTNQAITFCADFPQVHGNVIHLLLLPDGSSSAVPVGCLLATPPPGS